jgi:hypothetical protein
MLTEAPLLPAERFSTSQIRRPTLNAIPLARPLQ